MDNKDISYETSTNYSELYELLKSGNVVIGFIGIDIHGMASSKHSKLILMNYNSRWKCFHVGMALFESDFDKDGFCKACMEENLRFIPIYNKSDG